MIEFRNVSFGYTSVNILSNINFKLNENKITVLLGKNGTGKTTLLNLCYKLLEPIEGEVISEDSVYISDNPVLYEHLTGYEYIDLIKALKKDVNEEKLALLINELEIQEHLYKLIHEYSLGTKHKLAILTSLILDFKTYLIDEPLTALDPNMQKVFINYFKKMKKNGNTLLISTHMLHIAYELADDILILHNKTLTKVSNNFDSYEKFEDYVLKGLDGF